MPGGRGGIPPEHRIIGAESGVLEFAPLHPLTRQQLHGGDDVYAGAFVVLPSQAVFGAPEVVVVVGTVGRQGPVVPQVLHQVVSGMN